MTDAVGTAEMRQQLGGDRVDLDQHRHVMVHAQRHLATSAIREQHGALECDTGRGFFVVEPKALDYIESDVMWEHAPMEKLAATGQLFAYKHEGFWQCMDTIRDLRYLESLWEGGQAPWKTW